MSLKDDLEMVKEELTSEEKFFEKAVMTEKFVKKYKTLMIASVVAVVFFVAGSIAYNINKQNTIASANQTLSELQAAPQNVAAEARLKSLSPALHDVWVYSQAVANKDVSSLENLKTSNSPLVADLVAYDLAQNSGDIAQLDTYAQTQDAIYKDLAQVQAAVILMNENKIDEAHQKLSMINVNSSLAQVARALMHYGAK